MNYKIGGAHYCTCLHLECCGHANCLRIPIDREESNERKVKESPLRSQKIVFGTTVS